MVIQFVNINGSKQYNLGRTLLILLFVFQATVLEEMPPFPERESSILAKLKKKKPSAAEPTENKEHKMPTAQVSGGAADGPAAVQVG